MRGEPFDQWFIDLMNFEQAIAPLYIKRDVIRMEIVDLLLTGEYFWRYHWYLKEPSQYVYQTKLRLGGKYFDPLLKQDNNVFILPLTTQAEPAWFNNKEGRAVPITYQEYLHKYVC